MRDKLEYCLKVTGECLEKAKIKDERGDRLFKFAKDYYNDALYYKKRDPATALEAVAYSHGFIDAGVLTGLIEIEGYHLRERDELSKH